MPPVECQFVPNAPPVLIGLQKHEGARNTAHEHSKALVAPIQDSPHDVHRYGVRAERAVEMERPYLPRHPN